MPLNAGSRLGPYEIESAVGAGGMGEIYRARDTRLDRAVAIKTLPEELSHDPERRARFQLEAKTIAALTHPHICALHDVGHQDGVDYLVMELLDGETLADRIARGRLPVSQALTYAVQIADGLAKAHGHGIVHRDLKPANIMLTRSGAKLLDFGLAKLRVDTAPKNVAVTATGLVTSEGQILGTLNYIARAAERQARRRAQRHLRLWLDRLRDGHGQACVRWPEPGERHRPDPPHGSPIGGRGGS
jgi:serine/threonine protein kinase